MSKLVRESRLRPEKQEQLSLAAARDRSAREAIGSAAKELLDKGTPIEAADQIVRSVAATKGLQVTDAKVRTTLKYELGFSYRMAKKGAV